MPMGPRSAGYTTSTIVARRRRSKMPSDAGSTLEGDSFREGGVDVDKSNPPLHYFLASMRLRAFTR